MAHKTGAITELNLLAHVDKDRLGQRPYKDLDWTVVS